MAQRRRRRGQGIVEYVLVIGLVSLAVIGALKGLGKAVDRTYGEATQKLEGIAGTIAGRAPSVGGAATRSARAMRLTEECLHPAGLVDGELGICTGCGESL